MDNVKEVKWIKIATGVFDNRKILQIESMPEGDALVVIWFKLLCLAGDINSDGMIFFTEEIPYTEEMLATEFRRPLQLVRLALKTFTRFGMIEIIDDVICISNWRRYQSAQKLDDIRAYNRLAKQRQRERDKQQAIGCQGEVNDMSLTSQPGVSLSYSNSLSSSNSIEEPKENVEKKEKRKDHGQYGWVKLTEAEYERLLTDLGQDELDRCIRYIDESAQSNGNKNKWKDWNLVIRKCSKQGWGLGRAGFPSSTGGMASGINPRSDGPDDGRRVFNGETVL